MESSSCVPLAKLKPFGLALAGDLSAWLKSNVGTETTEDGDAKRLALSVDGGVCVRVIPRTGVVTSSKRINRSRRGVTGIVVVPRGGLFCAREE